MNRTIKYILLSVTLGFIAAVLLVPVFNIFAYKAKDPAVFTAILAYAARFCGAALCGFLVSVLNKEKGLLMGMASGALYSLLFLAIGLAIGDISFLPTLITSAVTVVVSAVFGLLGLPSEKSSGARRKEMMKKMG